LKGESDSRIFLTFDDGPDPIWTPKVLETLHLFRARATFFVIAPLALRHPYLIRQMI
jgi:peptidoglycan/xylan/chitin deacetylase (PgdA/CDA1 family)